MLQEELLPDATSEVDVVALEAVVTVTGKDELVTMGALEEPMEPELMLGLLLLFHPAELFLLLQLLLLSLFDLLSFRLPRLLVLRFPLEEEAIRLHDSLSDSGCDEASAFGG